VGKGRGKVALSEWKDLAVTPWKGSRKGGKALTAMPLTYEEMFWCQNPRQEGKGTVGKNSSKYQDR